MEKTPVSKIYAFVWTGSKFSEKCYHIRRINIMCHTLLFLSRQLLIVYTLEAKNRI